MSLKEIDENFSIISLRLMLKLKTGALCFRKFFLDCMCCINPPVTLIQIPLTKFINFLIEKQVYIHLYSLKLEMSFKIMSTVSSRIEVCL